MTAPRSLKSALLLSAAIILALPAYASSTTSPSSMPMDHSMHMQHDMSGMTMPSSDAADETVEGAETDTPINTPATTTAGASAGQVEELPAPATTPTQLVPQAEPAMTHDMTAMDHGAAPAMDHGSHNGHDMAPLNPATMPQAATDRMGGTQLESTDIDGLRIFNLTAGELAWPLNDKVTVAAYAYNGQVPGPMIRVKAGEKIRINFTNNLKEPTTIHWHGVDVPIEMDGVPGVSQEPVKPGASFTYEFTVPNTPGSFFYHTHVMADKQQALGLSGAFIIDPAVPPRTKQWDSEYTLMLGEWTVKDGGNVPSMPMEGMFPNYFTINGKSWPGGQALQAKVGERVLLRVVNAGSFAHPIHLHGAPFKIIATDGHPVPTAAQLTKDTVLIGPGERYDLLWTPNRPGSWMVHCHINHHTMDNDQADGMGGMMLPIEVAP